jgi:hypothetical protein
MHPCGGSAPRHRSSPGIGAAVAVTATSRSAIDSIDDRVHLRADRRRHSLPSVIPRRTRLRDHPHLGIMLFALSRIRRAGAMMMVRTGRTVLLDGAVCAGLAGISISHYTSAVHSLAAIGVELDTIAAVVIGGTLISGSQSFLLGTCIDVLTLGLIQIHITFDGMLSGWRTEIVVGLLLFALILLPRILGNLPARRAAGARGSM